MIGEHASAILLLPSGHRAYDEDFTVALPVPKWIDVSNAGPGLFHLIHLHHSGLVDDLTRALYVLGGAYCPYGYTHVAHHAPDEAHDQ